MTSIFRSIVHSSIRKSIQIGSAVQQVLSNTWVFLTSTADLTFTRASDQFGIDSGGNLVKSTAGNPAFVFGEGILLEAAATNLRIESDDITTWSVAGGAITPNNTTGPTGQLSDTFVSDTSNGQHRVRFDTVVATSQHTDTVYLKNNGADFVSLFPQGGANGWLIVDLRDGTISNNGGTPDTVSVEDAKNGWYRLRVTDTAVSTSWLSHVYMATSTSPAPVFTGDGVSGFHIAASQLETGSFPTSYIPTAGATATRAATSLTRPWQFPANGISGQIKVRPQFDGTDDKGGDRSVLTLSAGAGSVDSLEVYMVSADDRLELVKRVSGQSSSFATTALSALNYVKGDEINVRFKADSTGIHFWVNALTKLSSAAYTGDFTTLLDTITVGARANGTRKGYQTVESLRIWNEAKSDEFLSGLS